MSDTRKAIVRQENGHQVIVLPEDVHLGDREVYVRHDPVTGDITISARASVHDTLHDLFSYVAAHPVSDEEWEIFDQALREAREPRRADDDPELVDLLRDDE